MTTQTLICGFVGVIKGQNWTRPFLFLIPPNPKTLSTHSPAAFLRGSLGSSPVYNSQLTTLFPTQRILSHPFLINQLGRKFSHPKPRIFLKQFRLTFNQLGSSSQGAKHRLKVANVSLTLLSCPPLAKLLTLSTWTQGFGLD